MGNLNKLNDLDSVLGRIASLVAVLDTEKQVGKSKDGTGLSEDYAGFMHRRPIDIYLREMRQRYESEGVVSHLVETYRLQKTIASISAFQNLPRKCETARNTLMRQLQKLADMTQHKLRHLYLVPPDGTFQPVTLDGADSFSLNNEDPGSPIYHGPLPCSQAPNLIHTNRNGLYTIAVGDSDESLVDLEIGDDTILISLPKHGCENLSVDVYFNGIDSDCRRTPQRYSANKLIVSHSFDNPEFMNVTVIQGAQPDSLLLVFWSGIEKQIITHILERVYTDSQQRLAWWWKPQDILGGWSPVQCIQARREDAVLSALCSQHNIKELVELSR